MHTTNTIGRIAIGPDSGKTSPLSYRPTTIEGLFRDKVLGIQNRTVDDTAVLIGKQFNNHHGMHARSGNVRSGKFCRNADSAHWLLCGILLKHSFRCQLLRIAGKSN